MRFIKLFDTSKYTRCESQNWLFDTQTNMAGADLHVPRGIDRYFFSAIFADWQPTNFLFEGTYVFDC